MQRSSNTSGPAFLAEHEADAALLRSLGAHVWQVCDRVGIAEDDVVLIARGNGEELIKGMNLSLTGRFLNVEGALADIVRDHPDPLGLLSHMAHDIYWEEERPLAYWTIGKQPPGPQARTIGSIWGRQQSHLLRGLRAQARGAISWRAGDNRVDSGRRAEEKMSTVKLLICRHGSTALNKGGATASSDGSSECIRGWKDVPLDAQGGEGLS